MHARLGRKFNFMLNTVRAQERLLIGGGGGSRKDLILIFERLM